MIMIIDIVHNGATLGMKRKRLVLKTDGSQVCYRVVSHVYSKLYTYSLTISASYL